MNQSINRTKCPDFTDIHFIMVLHHDRCSGSNLKLPRRVLVQTLRTDANWNNSSACLHFILFISYQLSPAPALLFLLSLPPGGLMSTEELQRLQHASPASGIELNSNTLIFLFFNSLAGTFCGNAVGKFVGWQRGDGVT